MFCSNCGNANSELDQFCAVCGKSLNGIAQAPAATVGSPLPNQSIRYSGPSAGQTSGKAIASLVLGFCSFIFPAAIAAVILGHMSVSEIKKSAGRLKGNGMAICGLVFGYLGIVFIPFVLIIAAIAIPNLLRARTAANEASAVASLRTIMAAEATYASQYPDRGYACDLQFLGGDGGKPTADRANLINNVLASGTKSGYEFELRCNGSGYSVVAKPVTPNTTGTREFCTDDTAVIHYELSKSRRGCDAASPTLR